MPRRDLNQDEEKRSYAGVWLLGAAFLVVGALWAILDDVYLRRPWKSYQHGYHELVKEKERAKLAAEEAALEEKPEYAEVKDKLAEEQAALATGETAAKLADAQTRLSAAQVKEGDADLQVRFVKSELEAAWYEYDHALEVGGNVTEAQKHRDELIAKKAKDIEAWDATKAVVARIEAEINEIQSPVRTLQKEVEEHEKELSAIQNRLTAMNSVVANIELEPIATIQQIVLPDYDINNFEQPVDRVDRCTSCHMGISKVGLEDAPAPWATHPSRDPLITQHPPDKQGCTGCHDGQGVALNSIAQAHGNVRFWLQPLLEGPQMQSRCLNCHRNVDRLPSAHNLAEGEYLFEQLGCAGCHLVQDYEDVGLAGPSLRKVAAKVDPQWMVEWIRDPYKFRPRTKMPYFYFSEEQSKATAAYLWSSSQADSDGWLAKHPDPGGIQPADAAQVERGKALFDEVGCRACHGIGPDEVATPLGTQKDYAPNLGRVGEKTTARFVYWWIKDPRSYNAESRMPSLRLTDDEARDITSYLMSLSAGAELPEQTITAETLENEELVAEGKALVRKYGCFGCHAINGMDEESRIGVELSTFAKKPLEELAFGINPEIPRTWNDWTYHKLQDPRLYATEHVEQLMPNFKLSDEDIINIRVWLASRTGTKPPMRYRAASYDDRQKKIQEGRRVLQRYNCTGCHVIDDRGGYVQSLYEDNPTAAPPSLNGEGGKVQPEWLFGFLQDPARQPLRFWLKIRMPTFGMSEQETTAVVDYFTSITDLRDPYFFWSPQVDSTPELLNVGEELMSDEYFSCWSCHVRGEETPAGPMEQWAPNLAYAHERLNPGWIVDWIKDPQALMPGTKMPAFYPGGPPNIFDGDEDKQVVAMRDYIMSLGSPMEVAKSAPMAPEAEAADGADAEGDSSDPGGAQREASLSMSAGGGPG